MKTSTHKFFGALASVCAVYFGRYSQNPLPFFSGAALGIGIFLGSTAPDWLELPSWDKRTQKRISVIPHRTITHWVLGWVILLGQCLGMLRQGQTPELLFAAGFCGGAILHCFLDATTPMGVPWIFPWRRQNLRRVLS